MEKLPKKFKKNGFIYEEIKRMSDVAIYSQSTEEGRLLAYEVFIVMEQGEGTTSSGIQYKAKELMPGTSLWGIHGFTCHTIERAEKYFKELYERQASKI